MAVVTNNNFTMTAIVMAVVTNNNFTILASVRNTKIRTTVPH